MADRREARTGIEPYPGGLRTAFKFFAFLAFSAFMLFLPPESSADDGQLTLYLNGPSEAILDISFDIEAISIVDEDGISHEVLAAPVAVSSSKVTGRQMRLGETDVPEAKYTALRFIVRDATVAKEKGAATLALPPDGLVEVLISARVQRGRNTTLFVLWEADTSVKEGYLFAPAFSVRGEAPELLPLLVFVSNEESGNVSVLNRQDDEVVATVKTGDRPTGVAAGQLIERLRVYVVNTGSNSVSIINPSDNRVEQEVPIRFGREPYGVAASAVSTGREVVFVANRGSDTVSAIDGQSYEEIDKAQVGNGPEALAADPPVQSFLASRFLSASDISLLAEFRERFVNVYVANRNSREVSVLRWDIRGNRFDSQAISVGVDWTPLDISVDPQRGKVYVTNYDSDKLSIIDMVQLVKGNTEAAVTTISNLGSTSTGVVADPSLDRIYLLNESSDDIILIRPPREVPGVREPTLSPIVGTIRVGEAPRNLLIDNEGRKLYIVNRGDNTVSVVDKTTRRQIKVIPIGKKPYGITMFPQF